MFCSTCGTQVPDDANRCTNCGAAMRSSPGAALASVASSGAVKGFFILIASWFTMPLKTMKLTAAQLREIGTKGAFDISSDLPHLSWVRVAGGVLACAAVFGVLIYFLIQAFRSLGEMNYSVQEALTDFIKYLILGALGAVIADWAVMYLVELISLWVGTANNIKKMADRR
jgi:hypothetical protein